MYIKLIRNKPQDNAITGRLIVDSGQLTVDTLERKGYEILALCYHVQVTMSPKFKRLLPLVTNVPQTPQRGYKTATTIGRAESAIGYRQGIRFHVGTKPEHSTGCVLVPNRAIEKELTDLILKAQKEHEEIILEVIDFRPGTEHGYNTPCPPELQKHVIDSNRGKRRLNDFHPEK